MLYIFNTLILTFASKIFHVRILIFCVILARTAPMQPANTPMHQQPAFFVPIQPSRGTPMQAQQPANTPMQQQSFLIPTQPTIYSPLALQPSFTKQQAATYCNTRSQTTMNLKATICKSKILFNISMNSIVNKRNETTIALFIYISTIAIASHNNTFSLVLLMAVHTATVGLFSRLQTKNVCKRLVNLLFAKFCKKKIVCKHWQTKKIHIQYLLIIPTATVTM